MSRATHHLLSMSEKHKMSGISTVVNRMGRCLSPLAVLGVLAACGGGGGDAGTSAIGTGSGTGTTVGAGSGGGVTAVPTTPGGGISTVSSGIPNQRFMSISVEKYALNWAVDGDATSVTIRVADSAGNPVPDGTRVQFSTSGGQIQTSCVLTGVAQGAAPISSCSVQFATQDYRPNNGIVSIVAWLEGEEAFRDVNGNGKYDSGEPFADSGQLFRDDTAEGTFTPGFDELNVGTTLSSAPGIGTSACVIEPTVPLNAAPMSVDNTCDGVWGRTLVRASVYLPVSDPRSLEAEFVGGRIRVWSQFGANQVAAPSGTTITVKSQPDGCTVAVSPSTVPATAVLPTFHTLSSTGATCGHGLVGVEVKFGDYAKLVTAVLP